MSAIWWLILASFALLWASGLERAAEVLACVWAGARLGGVVALAFAEAAAGTNARRALLRERLAEIPATPPSRTLGYLLVGAAFAAGGNTLAAVCWLVAHACCEGALVIIRRNALRALQGGAE